MIETTLSAILLVGTLISIQPTVIVDQYSTGQTMYEVLGCVSCHGEHGITSDEEAGPSLIGLDRDYILTQLINFQTGERISPTMNAMAIMIEGYEEDVADYLASQVKL